MTMTRLSARALEKRLPSGGPGSPAIVDGFSIEVDAGELVVVTGPSGSGKTTLLALLAGWVEPDAGWVRFAEAGGDMRSPTSARWTEVALVPQGLGLLSDLSVEENVGLPLRWATPARADAVETELERFGLESLAGRRPAETSLGEQQRAAVARALVSEPLAILADEPTAHQDRRWGSEVFNALLLAARAGAACVIASHDPAALDYADRVIPLGGSHEH